MFDNNRWGGTFEVQRGVSTEDQRSTTSENRQSFEHLEEPQLSWLLDRKESKKKNNYIDLGCFICKKELLKWLSIFAFIVFVTVGIPLIVFKNLPKHRVPDPVPDDYTVALQTALKFFNAQKSGRLPKNNGVPWRGNSGLDDGPDDAKGGLVGGYYDSGNNIKFHFPMAFSITLLCWSVIEYAPKYREIDEYNHIRDTIKWGTDYLLRTFNSSASTIDKMYSQVGIARTNSTTPDDGYCWQKPEDMTYARPVQTSTVAPDLGAEVASALAAASLVFRDDNAYSKKLIKAAKTSYKFATGPGLAAPYSKGNLLISEFYNSTSYWDELIWSAAWMFYATGNSTYLERATDPKIFSKALSTLKKPDSTVFSWDNKLLGAQLLLTRLRVFLNPGYPYEEMLADYHNKTDLALCSYFREFSVFNYTRGGLIQLNHGQPHQLQYAANAAFLSSLFSDYMNIGNIPGFYCGPNYFNSSTLKSFAASQINYILGANPRNMSYLVGYGDKYPMRVHHRGASMKGSQNFSCTEGWKWRDSKASNPNIVTGAMVGGPDRYDAFSDTRNNRNYTEPTLAGNSGLVAALVSLTRSDSGGIDRNTIFTSVPPLYPRSSPPPPSWKP